METAAAPNKIIWILGTPEFIIIYDVFAGE
jgi:hypothetical protein